MKKNLKWLLAFGLSLMAIVTVAQNNQPPAATTDIFAKMYPAATNVDWKEKTNNFTAFFNLNDRKCEAKFAKSGGWLSTEETIAWDSLPRPVQDAFKTSKYADWKEASAYSILSSEGTTQYHLVVSKSDAGRKILFFSLDGKLLADR
jgi:hypothetical protein